MKRANRISEIINAFSPEPLKVDQMAEFYCDDTMEYRMSDKYSSPIEDIFEICQEENSHSAFLLLGHKGCGKSTELNRLSNDLHVKGYQVKTIVCSMDLDMFNIVYSDLFILMGEALLEIAEESGKAPVIIFEDLDKLNPEDAWNVFYNYASVLSGMPFSVIYTFPIALSYDTRFSAMEAYFITKTLPMIKIETIEGNPYEEGIRVIREIVEKRADLQLFKEGVLESLIRYSGGSLRDLFQMINSSAKRAERRGSERIFMEDAERALEEVKTSLTRRIEKKDYDFLVHIYQGNKELIEDKQMLLKMLQASVVLEYNGKRWHNIHPLVARFFAEQGLV